MNIVRILSFVKKYFILFVTLLFPRGGDFYPAHFIRHFILREFRALFWRRFYLRVFVRPHMLSVYLLLFLTFSVVVRVFSIELLSFFCGLCIFDERRS